MFIATKLWSFNQKNKDGGSIINLSMARIISPDQRIYKKLNFMKPVTYSTVKHGVIQLPNIQPHIGEI